MAPPPMITAARGREPSDHELSEQAVSIMATAMILARRGIPRPARWSRTSGPIVGSPSTHASNRGLDRAKQAAARTKNPVVGSPGTTMPTVPSPTARSEEHTSELQSRRDLVCRLLLEKKKKKIKYIVLYKKKIKKK